MGINYWLKIICLLYKMENQQSFKLSLASHHHIQSFNYISDCGLQNILNRFVPM